MSSSRLSSSPNSTSPPGPSTSSTSRIGTLSTLNQLSDPTDLSVKVFSAGGTSSSMPSSPSTTFDDKMKPRPDEGELRVPEDSDNLWALWWGDSEKHAARPWYNPPKKKKTVPSEQTEALQSTRKRVAQAIASALGTAADIAHEALFIGVDLLDLAPVPGLKPAAQLLLNIWDASQLVDMNRLGCLRLTERCADILISVRVEISDAGDVLGQELAAPVRKLEESFEGIHHFLIKQSKRPFLKRYLRRDEILEDISTCDSSLRDALGLFGVSIQIRILRQVQEAEKHRQAETQALLDAINGRVLPSSDSNMHIGPITSETATPLTTRKNSLGLFDDHGLLPSTSQDLPHPQIIPALTSLHSLQNLSDRKMDTADLRQLLRAALQTTSDVEMLEVLQVGRQEMPDAIKTLQRTLEHVAERDDDGVEASPSKSVVTTVLKEVEGPGASRKRSETILSIDTISTVSSGHSSERRRDTLDREFIESGIDCLRRMSRGVETSLPSWTITKYEVDPDKKIGVGFFSDVYRGKWRERIVAIKVLADTTPRNLFVREMGIWKTLRHPNVLRLCGASSASGDPPWFFVSPYMKNGSLVQYLKQVELEVRPSNLGIGMGSSQMSLSPIRSSPSNFGSGTFPAPSTAVRGIGPTRRDLTPPGSRGRSPIPEDTAIHRGWDLFRFMHEIAKGMEYLHSEGVLHGDLKGANVLVDDKYRCVISDFGQSEMKSEAYRISGTLPPHGTLRWQSPELMAGQSQLTREIDVWAFSMCCVEILTLGRIPWGPLHSDDSVRHFVLKDDTRPPLPDNSRFNTQGLQDILRACWSTKPTQRPTFSKLVKDFKQLRQTYGQETGESPLAPVIDEESVIGRSPSPDMRPTSLPECYVQAVDNDLPDGLLPDLGNIFQTPRQSSDVPDLPHLDNVVPTEGMKVPEAMYTPTPSTNTISASRSDEHLNVIGDGYSPSSPVDETIANVQNERRYRLLLTHDYHPSLTLPLWDPSPVGVGAVGYLCKPQGNFVTLFNAFTPEKANHNGIQSLPSILGYGPAQPETYRQDKRTVGQKSMDVAASILAFPPFSVTVTRHYSYPLKAGHEVAYLCTETTDYQYLDKLDAPKKWFKTHIDIIMQTYGGQHHLQKEDLFLVIGTLSAENYALFVSHRHPEGHTHFNVYATPKDGQPWGTFINDTIVLASEHGPSDDEPSDIISSRVEAKKVSCHGDPWHTVLLARLRFKPDDLEPTSK